ncbi:MAG TPA: hypothetical protein VFT68_01395 [Lapillicoccus sp.]|nr:hypothetical protein [Lapillicoccus sp.]
MLRNPIRTIAVTTGAAALMTLTAAASSHAEGIGAGGGGKPVTIPSGMPTTWTFGAGDVCPFKTTIIDIVNESTGRAFPSGETLFTGRLKERITNDETGRTVVRNISGPGNSTFGPNGEWILTLSGSSIFWISDGHDPDGLIGNGLYISHGPVVFVDLVLVQPPASYENLCETVG